MNVRPFTDADAPAVAELLNADEERFYDRPGTLTGDDVLSFLHWSKEAWVWEDDIRIVASATFGVHGGAADVRGVVAETGRGVGTEIVERGEAFARGEGAKRILAGALEPNAAARTLFESRGYREVRRFYEMAIELTEAPHVPDLPDGLALDEVSDGEQRAFYDAVNEAFAEHWEFHPMPFDEWLPLRKEQHHDEHGPLWLIIRDGDEMAAVIRNEIRAGGGYVGAIGVRPAWRGRGLGKVLLYRTFAEFFGRGLTTVKLDVDAENETGATHLYERVGMHVHSCGVAFEKAIA